MEDLPRAKATASPASFDRPFVLASSNSAGPITVASSVSIRCGFRHIQAAGYDFDSPEGVFGSPFGGAPGSESGSGVMAFSWAGVVAANEATAARATLYANSPSKPVAESAWIPITDNTLGGLSNNGWPAC